VLKISRERLFDIATGVGIFIAISIPSLKLLYSGSLWNLAVIVLLLISFVGRGIIDFILKKDLFITLGAFLLILLFSFVTNFDHVEYKFLNFIYFVFVVMLVLATMNNESIIISVILLISWSVYISVWQFIVGINYAKELGQTYLTVAMPIGCLFTTGLFLFFLGKERIGYKLQGVLFTFLSILALSTLLSRGAVLLPLLLFSLHTGFFLIYSCFSPLKKIVFITLLLFLFFFISGYVELLEMRQLYRIEGLIQSMSEEPRIKVYSLAIELISDSVLFGYGTGSAGRFFSGTYPHNIFLDILINGGVILLFPFILLCCQYITCIMFFYKTKLIWTNYVATVLLSYSLYLFAQWNISWGLDSSYIPIVTVIMYIYRIKLMKNNRTIGKSYA
jgi:O-antigen ligase